MKNSILLKLIILGLMISGLFGVIACSNLELPINPTTSALGAGVWQPDSSKIIQFPRADLELGTTISVPPSETRLIPITVNPEELLTACALYVKEDNLGISYALIDSNNNELRSDDSAGHKVGNWEFRSKQSFKYLIDSPILLQSGTYYICLKNESEEALPVTVSIKVIWQSSNSINDKPVVLPITGNTNLSQYTDSVTGFFSESKYGASTYQCLHTSAKFNLSKGQTIRIKVESDVQLNYNDVFTDKNSRKEIDIKFLELTDARFNSFRWTSVYDRGIEAKQVTTSNDGKNYEAVLMIKDVNHPDSNGQGIYSLMVGNADHSVSHPVNYQISFE